MSSMGVRAAAPAFTSWTETFVDRSRPTPAAADSLGAPERTLVTLIDRPKGTGPFPLIVVAPGAPLPGTPIGRSQLFDAWASAGYVVAAPAFLPFADVVNLPADISFVLTQVLRESRDPKGRLHGAIDRRHVGAVGVSLGGATTDMAVFGDCCRDRRFTSAMVLDGQVVQPFGNALRLDGHVPLLIANSDTDPVNPYPMARAAYDAAAAPVWLVTLHDADHYTQWADDPTPYHALGERLTTDFWNATLKGEKAALVRLQRDATVEGLSSIESRR